MKTLRWLLNIGTLILISIVPLVAWTGFYDSVEEPKMAIALWASALIISAWLVGCLAGKLRFWPQSSLTKVGTIFYILMAASGVWAGLELHLLEYTIFYAVNALLLMAWDSLFNSSLIASLLIEETDDTTDTASPTETANVVDPVNGSDTMSATDTASETGTENAVDTTSASDMTNATNTAHVADNYIWYLIGCLSCTCLLACAYAYLQKITPLGIKFCGFAIADPMNWNYPHLSQERTISTFGNPNYSGVWIASILPLSLSWIYTRTWKKWLQYSAFVGWLLCALVVIFTQTRAAWLGLGIGLFVWLVTMLICSIDKRKVLYTAGILFIGLVSVTGVYISGGERNLQRVGSVQQTISERLQSFKDFSDPSLQARLWFWKSALKTSFAFPWTGVGPYGQVQANLLERDSEPMYTRPHGQLPSSTHNQLLHIAATAGWPALILALISIGFALNASLHLKSVPLKSAFLAVIIVFWVAHIFTSFTVSTEILWIFMVAAISALSSTPFQLTAQDLELDSSLMQLNSRARLGVILGSIILIAVSLATFMDLASLRFGALGDYYCDQAQELSRQPDKHTSEILLTYDQANAYYELASALSPAWMTWNYNLEISKVFRQVYVEVLPEPDSQILFKAIEYASIAAAFAPEKTAPLLNWASILAKDPQGLEEAVRLTNQALVIDPRNPRILIAKVQFLIELQRFSEATIILNKLDSITPNLPTALYSRFVISLLTHKEKEADKIMQKLEILDPQAKRAAEEFKHRRDEAKNKAKGLSN